jgi:hypothetical protein
MAISTPGETREHRVHAFRQGQVGLDHLEPIGPGGGDPVRRAPGGDDGNALVAQLADQTGAYPSVPPVTSATLPCNRMSCLPVRAGKLAHKLQLATFNA